MGKCVQVWCNYWFWFYFWLIENVVGDFLANCKSKQWKIKAGTVHVLLTLDKILKICSVIENNSILIFSIYINDRLNRMLFWRNMNSLMIIWKWLCSLGWVFSLPIFSARLNNINYFSLLNYMGGSIKLLSIFFFLYLTFSLSAFPVFLVRDLVCLSLSACGSCQHFVLVHWRKSWFV